MCGCEDILYAIGNFLPFVRTFPMSVRPSHVRARSNCKGGKGGENGTNLFQYTVPPPSLCISFFSFSLSLSLYL